MGDRHSIWLNIMARLKPNVSRKQAEAAMTVLYCQEQADGNGRNAAADCLRQRCESACGASGDAAKRDLDPPFSGASKGAIFRLVLIESLLLSVIGKRTGIADRILDRVSPVTIFTLRERRTSLLDFTGQPRFAIHTGIKRFDCSDFRVHASAADRKPGCRFCAEERSDLSNRQQSREAP